MCLYTCSFDSFLLKYIKKPIKFPNLNKSSRRKESQNHKGLGKGRIKVVLLTDYPYILNTQGMEERNFFTLFPIHHQVVQKLDNLLSRQIYRIIFLYNPRKKQVCLSGCYGYKHNNKNIIKSTCLAISVGSPVCNKIKFILGQCITCQMWDVRKYFVNFVPYSI